MGAKSRRKGVVGEQDACKALADVWPGLKRQYGQARKESDCPDVDAPGCPVWIEVKRQEAINVHAAMAQAVRALKEPAVWVAANGAAYSSSMSHRPPVIVHKRNRGEWLVTVRAKDLKRLVGR